MFMLLIAVLLVAAGCAQKPKEGGTATPSPTTGTNQGGGTPKAADYKFGMVTDVGGVNDKSFNQAAWEGLQKLNKDTGANVKYLQSKSDAEYATNLTQFVKDNYSLSWGIGFLLGDAIKTVATQNPNAKLAIVDNVVDAPNVKSVVFAENEGSYLVGVVAGMTTKSNKIGFVGGIESPLIKRFEAGFTAGIKAVNPSATVIVNYTGAFDKPDLGKTTAATQYNSGADIIFHASGATGNGVFNEAKDRNRAGDKKVWVIGVDRDQSLEFGDDVTLTSMVKRVDLAVERISKEVMDGQFKPGTTTALALKDDAVGIPETSKKNVSADILKKVEEYKAKIVSGEIKVPTA
ncbi:BMP family lipoprotein [Paenibacillus koleovorans]|uniref:BMP family lipoprotein n=1 Tax=Paenibacillus koleovorans TaxID=121608 RepID=UPI000FD9D73C|nr:BMP family ABC transporter substrate-binding protein [Paenibacillus koleovorans]